MEQYLATVSGAWLAAPMRTQLIRIVIVVLISTVISSQLSVTTALRSVSATNIDVALSNASRVVVTASSELLDYSSKHKVEEPFHLQRHRKKFQVSSYISAALKRQQSQPQQKRGGKGPDHHFNLRKLSSGFGCMADPTMCLTVPGLTMASNASTCCTSGFCTDVQFDGFNCGSCGNFCEFGYTCCSEVCVATGIDPLNCGGCGNVCKGGECMFGFCNY